MEEIERFADGLGPAKIIHVHEPSIDLRGTLVVDNVAAGPSIGGVRLAPDVTTEECVRLARAMTLKNAAAGLAHGGGKSVMLGDPRWPREQKERHVRGFDFLYVVYDNEGYGNTGQQASAATPHAARTSTTTLGFTGTKKDLFVIWVAHRPTYAATGLAAEPVDLARKIEKAADLRGPRLIHVLAPCPTGWDYDPEHSVDLGRLAVRTGVFPLKEYVDGRVVHTKVRRPRLPVEKYLRQQGRFRHLFEPERDDAAIAEIQAGVDAYWEEVGEGGAHAAHP